MKEIRVNKNRISHIELWDAFEGLNGFFYLKYYWLEETVYKFLWIPVGKYPAGFYADGSTSRWNLGRRHTDEYKADYTLEEVEKSDKWMVWPNEEGVKSIWTRPHVKIFIGEKLVDTLYFPTFEEVQQFCDRELPTVKQLRK